MLNGILVGGFVCKISVNKINGLFYNGESLEEEKWI